MLPSLKLKEILENIIKEAPLSGMSRSGGMPSWDHYIVKNFNVDTPYTIEADGFILDVNKAKIGTVTKGDPINILKPELTNFGQGKFATIKTADDVVGLVNISSIRKPTIRGGGSIGGANSKEFLPEKLGLVGKHFADADSMVEAAMNGLNSKYGEKQYTEIRNYLEECMTLVAGGTLNELFSKRYTLSKDFKIHDRDTKILSKNFGEVIAAIYTARNNQKAVEVYFAEKVNSPFYDYVMVKENGIKEYFSVKSFGGSSTTLANLNFLLDNFSDNNVLFDQYQHEFDVIMSLMNNKKEGLTTLTNINDFFDEHLPEKKSEIIKRLNTISDHKLKSLSQEDLTKWFLSMINTVKKERFIETMNDVYQSVFGDLGKPSTATSDVLAMMYDAKGGKDNGYIYYPMGAYIVKYLNNTGDYVKVLNILLNYGTYVHQFDVEMYPDSFKVEVGSFKKRNFRFDYNAMAKAPGNRPIGFIEGPVTGKPVDI